MVVIFKVGAPYLCHLHDLFKTALLLVWTAGLRNLLGLSLSLLGSTVGDEGGLVVFYFLVVVVIVLIVVLKIVILIRVKVLPTIVHLMILGRCRHCRVLNWVSVHVKVFLVAIVLTLRRLLLVLVEPIVLHVILLLLLVLRPFEVLVARNPVDSRVGLGALAIGVLPIVH